MRGMKKSFKLFEAFLIAAVCIAMTSSRVWCASGDLDPSFGDGGKFLLAHGDFRAVAFDANTGAIASVGSRNNKQLLIRTLAGKLDPEFGNGGVVVNSATHSGVGLVILPDSRIVTAGSVSNRISLSRYQANGAPDSSFGANGTVIKQIPLQHGQATATGLAIQSDGKFLIVGYATPADPATHSTRMFLARFNLDGTTDESFGAGGFVVTDLGVTDRPRPGRVFGRAVGLQSNGNIVVVGNTNRFPVSSIVARFLPDGSLDSSFGNNGTVENEACAYAHSVAINSASGINTDDRIVVAGEMRSLRPCLLRLTPDGGLDSTFNGNGQLIFPGTIKLGGLRAVIVSDGSEGPSGQIVAGGWSDTLPRSSGKFLLARVNPDGSFDSSFGNNGLVTTAFKPGEKGTVVQGLIFFTGTIVATGFSLFSDEMHAAMARYLQ
jgi:uncharacterized delta-60 repeat protein